MAAPTPPEVLVLRRTYDHGPAVLWSMWTDPEHFAAWYGPPGAVVTVVTMDVRVGGRRLVRMGKQTPDGEMLMWFTGEHLQVEVDRRLVYTDAVGGPDGTALLTDPATSGGHPTATVVTVELEQDAGQTVMTVTHAGIAADSPGATGWRLALDKLSARLALGTPTRGLSSDGRRQV